MFKLILAFLIGAIVIAGVGILMAKLLKNSKNKGKYITAVLLVLLILFLFILPSLLLTQALTVWQVFSYGVSQLNYIGIPIWFARAIVIVLIFPFLWAASRVFLGRKRRLPAYVVLTV